MPTVNSNLKLLLALLLLSPTVTIPSLLTPESKKYEKEIPCALIFTISTHCPLPPNQ